MAEHPEETRAERWQRMQDAFHAASAVITGERRAEVERQSGGDPSFVAQVMAMLDEDARDDSMLDHGVAGVATSLLETRATDAMPSGDFGPYHLVRPIGEGGMAVVFLAEREDLGSVAAIKLLHHAWISPARRERFASEQRTLAQLNHPGIAHLYDAGTLVDGTPWIAMEYVDGQTLTAWCRAHDASLSTRLKLFRQICEAVQHAHGHLIVHRDLKPSNILVTAEGKVKLVDFGIAKQLAADSAEATATRTGLQMMTPAYAAPEQIRGEPTGVPTDVYALGVVLYELLSGALPFDVVDRTSGEIAATILESDPPRPSVMARTATQGADASRAAWADLDVMCLTAMHREPARRYRTVDALLRDIDHYLHNQPLEARPDSAGYRLGKFVRRHRGPLFATGVVLSAIVAVTTVSAARIRTARDNAVTEADRAQRIQRFTLSLFEGGDESSEPGDSLRAVTLVERGVVEAATLAAEPVVQAELYQTLGSIFQRLGRLDRADSLLQRALTVRKGLGAGHPDLARSLTALALLRSAQSRLPEAEQLARDGLAASRRARPAGHRDIAAATTALGKVLEDKGAYTDAIAVMRDALALHSALAPVSVDVAAAATQLGNDYFYAGDYAGADSLFRRSRDVAQALYGDRHPLVADALINLGAVQFQRGEFAAAERFDRDGLAIIQRVYGHDDPRTAAALTMLGRALVAESRFDEAAPQMQQALAIRERVFGPVSPQVASTLNEIGITALRTRKYDEADAHFARNVAIYQAVYHGPHNLLGTALSNRGSVFLARGDNVGAEKYYREALAVYLKILPPTHLDVGIVRVKLGRALLRQRRFVDGEKESAGGLAILLQQTSPSLGFVKNARSDLAQMYDSLGQPAKAAAMRAALADTVQKK